jgi:cellulose synthase/poly-beta-1,6-N-acetylglucosamine synthase-like glycosyltransferase
MIFRRQKELELDDLSRLMKSESLPPVAILVPMHNEEMGIIQTVDSLSLLTYPSLSVIVINDGSTDQSLELLKSEFFLKSSAPIYPCPLKTEKVQAVYYSEKFPSLMVIDKERGGKGDALNAGINATSYPLVLTVDADTVLEKDALLRIVPSFIHEKGVGPQGGTIRILKRSKQGRVSRYLSAVQSVEYLRAFLYGRLGWNALGGNLIVSGAFGLFNRSALIQVGGYNVGNITEDLEVTINLTCQQREKYQKRAIQFIPDAVAWTRGAETISALGRQRERWHRGLIESVFKHRKVLFNRKYGLTGFLAFPYLIIAEMIQPVVEVLAFFSIFLGLLLGIVSGPFLCIFLGATWGLHLLVTLLALIFEITTFQGHRSLGEFFRCASVSAIENLGFRQICVVWRFFSFYRYFTGYNKWR